MTVTSEDIRAAAPRQIECGVIETGPFCERRTRGGYFTASGREFHWYEESGAAPACCMSRDDALRAARESRRTIYAEAA
ncbi:MULTISPECIES: hypothetical protein [Burkholderia cepacia complex]|uniref:hypothetical protein n=1 Tax=Burkholderia cepacia complex TaxID=87882 RepID=UPI001B96E340|nr:MULTISPECIES: hypothetical protein [Burkholderia cepacia complex]MBR8280428.1 hypothetical protein [Burkholderia vietnamiensis]MCA7962389.1 hypothetical protein [Burkholderia cenocepacia]MDR8054423.1 hypothetical protein [Burkholderia cenocepacia]MDR8064866.1 hypothetical protein [Burkholderia cenocepacia]